MEWTRLYTFGSPDSHSRKAPLLYSLELSADVWPHVFSEALYRARQLKQITTKTVIISSPQVHLRTTYSIPPCTRPFGGHFRPNTHPLTLRRKWGLERSCLLLASSPYGKGNHPAWNQASIVPPPQLIKSVSQSTPVVWSGLDQRTKANDLHLKY